VLLFCGACGGRSAPPPPLVAQASGTVEIAGLTAPVRIVRDGFGVPHVYAQNTDDLFAAQGFVQAQDRLFQMDLWRRSAQGRLSEVLGPNFVERDAMTRRVLYRGEPAAEWPSYGVEVRAIASAFVRGINAWVALARERPPEEFVLAGWKPEPWAPEDLLNRTSAFTTGGDAIDEVFRARLVAAVGAARLDALLPGNGASVVPRELDVTTISPVVGDAIRRVGTRPFFVGLAAAVSGDTVRLKPDTTEERENPSPRYLVHLNAPGWNVIGATSPWLPGVAVGHNEHVAWDATPYDADTQDVFVERLNPSNPHQVLDNGRWIDTTIVKQPITILRNPKPFVFDSEFTRHGVIVALDRARNLAFAVRWSGSEPGAAGELAALALNRATSVDDVTAALSRWTMPPRRFTYTATGGASGSQVAALVPIRRGWNGALPAPAWSGGNEWEGWQTSPAGRPAPKLSSGAMLARWARAHPDGADALLAQLAAAGSSRDALQRQRTIIGDALAEAVREDTAAAPIVFAHPLGITDAARQRFNVGPLAPPTARAPAFALTSDWRDWDRSTAINAPGQSGAPASNHFSDLARRWASAQPIPLPFSSAAVESAAAETLTLVPGR
jgi:penicillin amidase